MSEREPMLDTVMVMQEWNIKKDQQIAVLEEALKIACEEMIEDLHFDSEDDKHYTLQENIEYFKTMARKNIRGE